MAEHFQNELGAFFFFKRWGGDLLDLDGKVE
jgi:hypothetical protein